MTRNVTLATLFILSCQTAWAADSQQDRQTEMHQMQAAQARMMAAMVTEKQSRMGLNETLSALTEAAKQRGWTVSAPIDMQAVMQKAGHKDAKPFKVIAMCKKDLAETLIKTQAMHNMMPFAPCRVSVFEGNDGHTYIARPNTALMAQMAAPIFASLLQQFVAEEQVVISPLEK